MGSENGVMKAAEEARRAAALRVLGATMAKDFQRFEESANVNDTTAVGGVSWGERKTALLDAIKNLEDIKEYTKLPEYQAAFDTNVREQYRRQAAGLDPTPTPPPVAPAPQPQTGSQPPQPQNTTPATTPPAQTTQTPPATDNRNKLQEQADAARAAHDKQIGRQHVTVYDNEGNPIMAVNAYNDGRITISGIGSPYREDPNSGVYYDFQPGANGGTLTVKNTLRIRPDGSAFEPDTPDIERYALKFNTERNPETPENVIKTPEGSHETPGGVSDQGGLAVRVTKAHTSISEGNVTVSFRNPQTGETTKIYLDSNTAVIDRTNGNGQTVRAEQEIRFHSSDYRHQPGVTVDPALQQPQGPGGMNM